MNPAYGNNTAFSSYLVARSRRAAEEKKRKKMAAKLAVEKKEAILEWRKNINPVEELAVTVPLPEKPKESKPRKILRRVKTILLLGSSKQKIESTGMTEVKPEEPEPELEPEQGDAEEEEEEITALPPISPVRVAMLGEEMRAAEKWGHKESKKIKKEQEKKKKNL